MRLEETLIETQEIFNGRIISLRDDTVMLSNGKSAKREVVHHSGGVCVLALDADDSVTLVRQFRYPYKKSILEVPAGKKEPDEDPLTCGKRELKEETGLCAEKFIFLGELYPTPGYVDEIITMYLATSLTQTKQQLDEDEFLDVVKMPFTQAITMVLNNEIADAKTQTALLKAKLLRDNGIW